MQIGTTGGRSRGAFTLIELLVVIAIIALLIGILLPSLGAARGSAQDVACLANERSLGQGMAIYTTENREWLPGPNTSGLSLHTDQEAAYVEGSSSPTQDWDWISPIIGDMFDLPTDRLSKYEKMLNVDLACPRNNETYADLYDGPPLRSHEENPNSIEHPRIMSYTISAMFLLKTTTLASNAPGENVRFLPGRGGRLDASSVASNVVIPEGYGPKLTLVGMPARKSMGFEGGGYFDRNLNAGRGGLDYTTSANAAGLGGNPQGNFISVGPYLDLEASSMPSGMGGMARVNGEPSQFFKDVFLRHNNDSMAMVFFDGHAAQMNHQDIADPSFFVPEGSRVLSADKMVIDTYEDDDKIF